MYRLRALVRFHKHHLVGWASTVFLACLIITPITLFMWLLFFTNTFSITAVTVVDARPVTEHAVRSRITDASIGKNLLFMQTKPMERLLIEDVPQIKDVHIIRKLPGTLKIIIQERNPSLLLLSGGTYYFLDDQGVAYEIASLDTLPGIVLPVIKNSDKKTDVTLGTRAVDEQFIGFVATVQEKLPKIANAHVVEMRIPSLAAREAHFLLDRNWKILMDTTQSADNQLGILSRLLKHTITAEEQQTLEYIDLRIPNRVYYKSRL